MSEEEMSPEAPTEDLVALEGTIGGLEKIIASGNFMEKLPKAARIGTFETAFLNPPVTKK